ncbi:MAG: hypothetical protein JJV96_00940 [Alphaproteobacteria bacterium]|nr:hypothetical protein [Alphaproteobacteria bacterium]
MERSGDGETRSLETVRSGERLRNCAGWRINGGSLQKRIREIFSHSVGSSIGCGTFLKSLQITLQTDRNNKRYFIITPWNNYYI